MYIASDINFGRGNYGIFRRAVGSSVILLNDGTFFLNLGRMKLGMSYCLTITKATMGTGCLGKM